VGALALGGLVGEVVGRAAAAIFDAVTAGSRVATATTADLPRLTIDAGRMPGIAQNIQSAQDAGLPSILNRETEQAIIDANRAAATRGFRGPGSPDEYPFASTTQGGAGARVSGVPLIEQKIQGGILSRFYQDFGIGQGDSFQVFVDWGGGG
jgi:hypothetical protein